jgi:hypothetical protein
VPVANRVTVTSDCLEPPLVPRDGFRHGKISLGCSLCGAALVGQATRSACHATRPGRGTIGGRARLLGETRQGLGIDGLAIGVSQGVGSDLGKAVGELRGASRVSPHLEQFFRVGRLIEHGHSVTACRPNRRRITRCSSRRSAVADIRSAW